MKCKEGKYLIKERDERQEEKSITVVLEKEEKKRVGRRNEQKK